MSIARQRVSQLQIGGFQERLVKIKSIVFEDRMIIAADESGTEYRVPLYTVPTTYRLPRVGEFWYMGKTMGQWQLKHMQGEILYQYYTDFKVVVESIDGHIATVKTVDADKERTFKIDTRIKRYKSYMTPQVGETWIVDNSIGQDFTFAAFIGSVPEPEIPTLPDIYPGTLCLYIDNHDVGQSVGSGTGTFLQFGTASIYDPYSFWSSGLSSRIIPTFPGNFQCFLSVVYPGVSGGNRTVTTQFNGEVIRGGRTIFAPVDTSPTRKLIKTPALYFNGTTDYIRWLCATSGTTGQAYPAGQDASYLEVYYVE